MSKDVFISFASKDQAVANATCKAIEDRGYSCWISSRDVRPGRDYAEEITAAIEQCKLMVFVYSQNSNNSDEVKREITLASQNLKIVIPLLTEDIKMSPSFRYHLATRNWIDCSQGWEASLEILFGQLEQITKEAAIHPLAGSKSSRGYLADAINDTTKISLKGSGSKARIKGSRVRNIGQTVENNQTAEVPEVLAPVVEEVKQLPIGDKADPIQGPSDKEKIVKMLGAIAAIALIGLLIFFSLKKATSTSDGGISRQTSEYAKSLTGNWVEASSGLCNRDMAQISVNSNTLSWKASSEQATNYTISSIKDGWLILSDDIELKRDADKLLFKFSGGILEYKSCD